MFGVTVSGGIIAAMSITSAEDISPIDDEITITVDSACTMGQTTLSSNPTLNPGETNTIGTSRIAAYCNDSNGYDIYAIGYTNGEYGNTSMQSADGSHTIPTGISGTDSYWNMRLAPGTATGTTSYIPTVESSFTTNTIIPNDYAKVASFPSSTISQRENPLEYGSYIDATYTSHISTTQPAGVYTGQVQYVMVHPTGAPAPEIPPTYMQDTAAIKSKLTNIGDTTEVVDKRDGQEYTVARLADNKIWMTKNLNLAGGTEITSELSNVPDGYTLPTANGFQSGNKLPASSTSGFNDDTKAFAYNSTKTFGTDCSAPGCYSYYSWTAATAGSGLSITADNTDAPYSICPKGWKLPNSRSTVAGNSDFYQLAVAYGMDPSSTSQSTSNFYAQAGPGTTPNFLLTGYYYSNGSFYDGGSFGYYWSSTSGNSTHARYLDFNSSYVYSAYNGSRRYGGAVRCIAE